MLKVVVQYLFTQKNEKPNIEYIYLTMIRYVDQNVNWYTIHRQKKSVHCIELDS